MVQTMFYFLGLLCSAAVGVAAGLTLDEALIKDILPPPSKSCLGAKAEGDFSFTFKHTALPRGHWHDMNAEHEEDVFLAEMVHEDAKDKNKTWAIRVGRGGNIYSYIGVYGEVIPPQFHNDAPFVDEVWQSVAVDQTQNYKPSTGNKPWFIHQAGTYTRDDENRGLEPFYSPNTAKYCDKVNRECGFASWGQQAHIPTAFQSHVLYYTRFKDCGNGVLETVWGFHNMAGDHSNMPSYLNVPWGGVRGSIMSDAAHSHRDGSDTEDDFFKVHGWGSTGEIQGITDLKYTGGYTAVVENVYVAEEDDPTAPILPCSDGKGGTKRCPASGFEDLQPKFKVTKNAVKSSSHSDQMGTYVLRIWIVTTCTIKTGLAGPKNLEFYNGKGGVVKFTGALHWAWGGRSAFVYLAKGETASTFNKAFSRGDTLSVRMTPDWEHPENNLGIAFVYGKDKEYSRGERFSNAMYRGGRVRFGTGGSPTRDYEVFTVNAFVNLKQGYTYTNQQYVITGRYKEMHDTTVPWVDRTSQMLRTAGQPNLGVQRERRVISVVSHGDDAFAAVLTDDLLPGCGDVVCTGSTTAQRTQAGNNGISRPFFAISCGDEHYFGENMYHFAPADANNIQRPYICRNNAKLRPTWKLVGYFNKNACSSLNNPNKKFTPAHVCTSTTTTVSSTTTSVTSTTSTTASTTTTTVTTTTTSTISSTTTSVSSTTTSLTSTTTTYSSTTTSFTSTTTTTATTTTTTITSTTTTTSATSASTNKPGGVRDDASANGSSADADAIGNGASGSDRKSSSAGVIAAIVTVVLLLAIAGGAYFVKYQTPAAAKKPGYGVMDEVEDGVANFNSRGGGAVNSFENPMYDDGEDSADDDDAYLTVTPDTGVASPDIPTSPALSDAFGGSDDGAAVASSAPSETFIGFDTST